MFSRELPSDIKVAVVGNAGSGKSAFLNALLGDKDLAAEGGSGSACTQIITTYSHDTACGSQFHAKVIFKDKAVIDAEMRAAVQELLRHCSTPPAIRIKLSRREMPPPKLTIVPAPTDDSDSGNEASAVVKGEKGDDDFVGTGSDDDDDIDAIEALKSDDLRAAEDYLMHIFGDELEFRTEAELYRHFTDLKPEDHDAVISTYQKRAEELLQALGLEVDRSLTKHSSDTADLSEQLKTFDQARPRGSTGFWPLVAKIQKTFSSPLMAKGIEFSDCPGLSDINTMRRRAAQIELQSSQVIIAVSDIARIVDDKSIHDYIDTYLPQLGPRRMLIVATKCDIGIKRLRGKLYTDEATARIEALRVAAVNAKQAVKDAKRAKSTSVQAAKTAAKTADQVLRRETILLRNTTTTTELKRLISTRHGIEPEELPVVAVSSASHMLHFNEEEGDHEKTVLSPTEDGITAIRRALVIISQDNRPTQALEHIDGISAQINRFEVLLNGISSMHIEDWLARMAIRRVALAENTRERFRELRQILEQHLGTKLRGKVDHEGASWLIRGSHKIDEFEQQWRAANTVRAFFLRKGVFAPKRGPLVDWNELLITAIVKDLFKRLQAFMEAARSLQRSLYNLGAAAIVNIHEALKRTPDAAVSGELARLVENFELHKRSLSFKLHAFFDTLHEELQDSLRRIVSPHNNAKWVQTLHTDGFGAAIETVTSGARLTHRRFDVLRQVVSCTSTSDGVFPLLVADVQQAVAVALARSEPALLEIMQSPCDEMAADLKLKFAGAARVTLSPQEKLDWARARVQAGVNFREAKDLLESARQCVRDAVQAEEAQRAKANADSP